MSSGNVSGRENHGHQGAANRERAQHARVTKDNVADGKDLEKCADEFCHEFVHVISFKYRRIVVCPPNVIVLAILKFEL